MDWPWCSSSSSASAALGSDSLPWERGGAGRRPSKGVKDQGCQGPWSSALPRESIPPVGPSSSLHLTHSSVPSPTGTPRLCSSAANQRGGTLSPARLPQPFLESARRCCVHFSVSANSSPLPGSPAVLSALHARLAVAIDLASSAHTPSDLLAVIMSFSTIF